MASCLGGDHHVMAPPPDPYNIASYEGLIRKTAAMYAPHVEEEFDDICQHLRVKVWKALETYDERKSRMPVERYVFMCVKNRTKDLFRKVSHGDLHIEDLRTGDDGSQRDWFDARYLSEAPDQTYATVEDGMPVIPSTLSSHERHVVVLLYRDYRQAEIARLLGLSRWEMECTIGAIRSKMADWRPTTPLPLPQPSALAA